MEKKSIFPWRNFKEVEPTKEVTENSKQLEIDEKLQLANKNRVSSLINPNGEDVLDSFIEINNNSDIITDILILKDLNI